MAMVSVWTGRHACALQEALLLSNERFARRLKVSQRAVAAWHEQPDRRPQSAVQRTLDETLEHASPVEKSRFAELIGERAEPSEPSAVQDPAIVETEQRLISDPAMSSILGWLDASAASDPGTSRRKLAARLVRLGVGELEDRGARRGGVSQRQIAESLSSYYGGRTAGYGLYGARHDNSDIAITSVLTRPDWLDLECRLSTESDRLNLVSGVVDRNVTLDELTADAAVQRLAETLTLNSRLVDTPLYWLKAIDVHKGSLAGSLGLVPFVRYALTMDLLEGELVDAVVAGRATVGTLPLRDRLLPDLASVVGVSDRLCSGGALALSAIARPASGNRPADYVLLIQERSGRVLNAARRLAVMPKGFHQPLADFRVDAQVGSTLLREMEEELFGREDVDSTTIELLTTDPMHPSRLSEPMQWLTESDDRLLMECTGFGLNLVSGNCEFASLIVVDDEEFWPRYGGTISANWESGSLRQYSSLDRDLITDLIGDVAWSNEGLFALMQGLRRLAEIGGDRVNLPTIEWEMW